jgi:hypothetical protein
MWALRTSGESQAEACSVSLEPAPIFSVLEANALHHIPGVALPAASGANATVEFTFYPTQQRSRPAGSPARSGSRPGRQLLRNRFSKLTDAALNAGSARSGRRAVRLSVSSPTSFARSGSKGRPAEGRRGQAGWTCSITPRRLAPDRPGVVEVHDVEHRLRHITELLREKGFEVAHRRGATFRKHRPV